MPGCTSPSSEASTSAIRWTKMGSVTAHVDGIVSIALQRGRSQHLATGFVARLRRVVGSSESDGSRAGR
jgi:hypothetical protein